MMRLGQYILLAAMVAFAVYATRLRSSLWDRVVFVLLGMMGVLLVMFPNVSTRLANLIGIGRGADLIVYVFIAFSLFVFASTASHFRRIDRQITQLVRALSIRDAVHGNLDRGSGTGRADALSRAAPEEPHGSR